MTAYKRSNYLKRDKLFYIDIAFIILMMCAFLFSFWKCKYGFGGNDEAFYLCTPQRLILGDSLLSEEWHLSQLSAFLLYPFVWLFTAITGGTTGIILAARYTYIMLHFAVSILIYVRLRKYELGALAATILFFLFTPFDIMSLSYNTMGIDLVAVTGVLLATADYKNKAVLIFSGIAFAGAVLCQPYLIMAYVLFALCVTANIILKKLKKNVNFFAQDYFSLKTFLFFTLGAAVVAAIFFTFLLSRAGIGEIMQNIPYILSDPEHPELTVLTRISYLFRTIWESADLFNISIVAYFIILFAMIIDEKRRNHRGLYLLLTSITVIFALITFIPRLINYNYNFIMFPFIYLGISSYILSENKNRNLMACLFSLGIIYSFALSFTSNQYFYIVSCAISASNIASFVFLGNVLTEMKNEKEDENEKKVTIVSYTSGNEEKIISAAPNRIFSAFAIIFAVVTILFQACLQTVVKANHCFWEQPMEYLNSTLSGGPADGIITYEANAQNYQNLLYDINQAYDDKQNENILFLTQTTWTYLAAEDMNYATFSGWISGENKAAAYRLEQYFALHPDKIPKYIYIPKASEWDLTNLQTEAAAKGYAVNETIYSYQLEKQ